MGWDGSNGARGLLRVAWHSHLVRGDDAHAPPPVVPEAVPEAVLLRARGGVGRVRWSPVQRLQGAVAELDQHVQVVLALRRGVRAWKKHKGIRWPSESSFSIQFAL